MQQKWVAWLLMAYLVLVWGSSYVLMNEALKFFSPWEVAALRITFAGLSLLPFVVVRFRQIPRKKIGVILLIGLVSNTLPAFLFPLALTRVTTATAGILNSLAPVWTLVLGAAFFGFNFSRNKYLGVFLGLAGAILLVFVQTEKPSDLFPRDVGLWEYAAFASLIIVATFGYGLGTNLFKTQLNAYSAVVVTGLALGSMIPLATGFLLAFTDVSTRIFAPEASVPLLALLALALLGTSLALVLYNRMLQLTDPIFASSVTYIMPGVVLLFGVFIGEKLVWAQFVGLALILGGVMLINRKKPIQKASVKNA